MHPLKFHLFSVRSIVILHTLLSGEHQGVGGIFFDGLSTPDLEHSYNFLVDCCNSIIPCYMPLVVKHVKSEYTEEEKQWQLIRRGRYLLIYKYHE